MLTLLKVCMLLCFLLAAAWVDIRRKSVPNRLIAEGFLGWCVLLTAEIIVSGKLLIGQAVRALLEGGLTLLVFFILAEISRHAIGMGDVKLLGMMALYCGVSRTYASFFYALLMAAAVSLGLMAAGKRKRRDRIAFVPFLLAGYCLSFLFTGVN